MKTIIKEQHFSYSILLNNERKIWFIWKQRTIIW